MEIANPQARLLHETSVNCEIEGMGGDNQGFIYSVSRYGRSDDEWDLVVKFHRRAWCLNLIQVATVTIFLGTLERFADVNSLNQYGGCEDKFGISCIDLGVNLVLFFILLPAMFKYGTMPKYNQILFGCWTICIGADVALLTGSFSFREEALWAFVLTTIGVWVIWTHLYLPIQYVSWMHASGFSTAAVLVVGLVGQIWLAKRYFYSLLGAVVLVNSLLLEFRIVCNHVGPHEHVLASLFLLFPEGLACIAGRGEHSSSGSTSITADDDVVDMETQTTPMLQRQR